MSVYVGFKIGKARERKAYISVYYCGACGCPVSDQDRYCPECGGAFRKEDATERTCTNESASGKYFACSECGAELMQITPGWVALIRGSVNYCPNCGARVTGGARIEEESDDTI